MPNTPNQNAKLAPASGADRAELREALAELEHEQWRSWSRALANSEELSPERLEQWEGRWVEYSALSEADKDLDRKYADRILALLVRVGLLPAEHGQGHG